MNSTRTGVWAKGELQLVLHSLVDKTNPAMRVRELALALLGRFNESDTSPLKLAQAAALARIVTAVEREQPDGLHWVRVSDRPWVVISADCAPVLRDLGHVADELAKREILASPGEVTRSLRAKIDDTHLLASASDEQLATWAAHASEIAALSSRLEIYPKKLPASRALELTSPVLTGELKVDRILTLVSSRYPEAEALPLRPELDPMLARFGLKWHPSNEVYARLVPMLAGLLELLPWLLQWHNEPSEELGGQRPGEQFALFLEGQCAEWGLTHEELRSWRPAAKRGRTGRR